MNEQPWYVGEYVTTKVNIPSDERGREIKAGTSNLLVLRAYGSFVDLVWPGGKRAASQIHIDKLIVS